MIIREFIYFCYKKRHSNPILFYCFDKDGYGYHLFINNGNISHNNNNNNNNRFIRLSNNKN